MHIGVFGRERLLHTVQDGERLLRRGGVVEIDQWLAIDLHRQRGKILAQPGDVELAGRDSGMNRLVHGHRARSLSQRSAAARAASRNFSSTIASIASPTKAWISSASA